MFRASSSGIHAIKTLTTAAAAACAITWSTSADASISIGTLGDSYTADAGYGGSGSARPSSENWVELLQSSGIATFGSSSDIYQYNYAHGGDTSQNQLSYDGTLQGNVDHNQVAMVVIAVGINDVIHDQRLADPSITNETGAPTNPVDNIHSMIQTLRAHTNVPIVLANVADPSLAPDAYFGDGQPTAAQLQALHTLTQSVNQGIDQLGIDYHIPIADWNRLTQLWSYDSSHPSAKATLGNMQLYRNDAAINPADGSHSYQPDANPSTYAWADYLHPTTVPQGLFANTILQAYNQGYGQQLDLLSGGQIFSGLDLTHFQYSNYVLVPNPASGVLMVLGTCLLLIGRRHGTRGHKNT